MKEKRGWRSWPALEPMMVINDLEESGSGLDVLCGVVIGLARVGVHLGGYRRTKE